jgi:hypothetical protein
MKGMDDQMTGMPERKPRSRATFHIDKTHGKMMPKGVEIGKKHSARVSGKISGMHSDEYGHSMDMDMDTLEHDTDRDEEMEPRSLTKAMRQRNRHMHSGRFVS